MCLCVYLNYAMTADRNNIPDAHKQYVGSFGSTGMSNTWTSGASRETATASDLGPSDSTLQKAPTYTVWTSTLVSS